MIVVVDVNLFAGIVLEARYLSLKATVSGGGAVGGDNVTDRFYGGQSKCMLVGDDGIRITKSSKPRPDRIAVFRAA